MNVFETAITASCFTQCYLFGMTEEDWEKILIEVYAEFRAGNTGTAAGNAVVLTIEQALQEAVTIPARLLVLTRFVKEQITMTQGRFNPATTSPPGVPRTFLNRSMQDAYIKILGRVRRKIVSLSVRIAGKGGAAIPVYRGVAKFIPYVGWAITAYEVGKACHCGLACEDGHFKDEDTILYKLRHGGPDGGGSSEDYLGPPMY